VVFWPLRAVRRWRAPVTAAAAPRMFEFVSI